MIASGDWKKAWVLLEAREQRNAWFVLGIIILGGLSSAMMIGSVLPFLSVLADPETITRTPALKWAYDKFGFASKYNFLIALGLGSLGVIIISSVIQLVKTWAVARFATMRTHSLSRRLLATYLGQPYEFFLNSHSGDMGTRILTETQQMVGQFLRPAAEAVASIFTISAIIILLLWAEPFVAIASFTVLGGVYSLTYCISRQPLKKLGMARLKANSARFRTANEALGGIKDIKLLGREGDYLVRYDIPSYEMARANTRVQIISAMPKFVLEAIAFGGIILLCLFLIETDGLESGSGIREILPVLGLFAFAGQRLMPELSKLYQSLAQIQAGSAAVEIVYRDLSLQINAKLPQIPPKALGLCKQLDLQNVSYSYPGSTSAGVKEISLSIQAGEKIGIVGGTGAGKTTLADLVLGLLNPNSGCLVVDGVTLNADNMRAWQQSVGYVPQDIFLTDASLNENIALGVPFGQIDQTRVEKAAKMARIEQFILTELPEGYATTIGERGVRLSGGQRQRIGIARALYHKASLIMFDEATSALDNHTEAEVLAAIEDLPGDTTVLMIAHRLSTVRQCDRIIVMEAGKIVGIGPWDSLIEKNAAFRKIAQNFQS